jgi:hypothetical protein
MKKIFALELLLMVIVWGFIALDCRNGVIWKEQQGVLWNYAAASTVDVLYNLHNPSSEPQYTPIPGRAQVPMGWAYNPRPFCWNCHGSDKFVYANTTTITYANYSAVQTKR